MIVPRSYAGAARSPDALRSISIDSISPPLRSDKANEWKDERKGSVMLDTSLIHPNLSPATPSRPVVIPTRTRHKGPMARAQGQRASRQANTHHSSHNSQCLSPSSVALLAMTSIPDQPRSKALDLQNHARSQPRRRLQTPRKSLSSSNPQTWETLLSPPDELDMELGSYGSDATLGPCSSVKSLSTDSMPSLADDEGSLASLSDLTPAGSSGNRASDRRIKLKQAITSLGENCAFDHPLLPPSPQKSNLMVDEETGSPLSTQRAPPIGAKRSFKSNLTASFRAIRSAAKSFSDFTTATSHGEMFLSQSVLSMNIPFTDERRPKPSLEAPEPALRRYLNPLTLSPAELHFHGQQASSPCESSIQLQACQPGNKHSANATSPPIFLSSRYRKYPNQVVKRKGLTRTTAIDTVNEPYARDTSPLPLRQREPRENCDFLRVVVLEMSMRKVGKLSDTSPGRARLWLPAREPVRSISLGRRERLNLITGEYI